tara:strand:- start:13549 stop:14451 length:903 start_codon:yes stop_codon:yes gene_type:complete
MKKVATINTAGSTVTNKLPFELKDRPQPLTDAQELSLHRRLQGSLVLAQLINRFHSWLEEHLPCSGVEYVYPDERIKLASGEARRHNAHYVLRLEQRYLGEVTVNGQQRLTESNLFVVEQAMGVLVHCIQNALDHLALEKVAYHDSLTGVMNRTALDELLPKEVDRAQRYGYQMSVAMIDIDHFKSVNDQIGHLGADEVLRLVSSAIQNQLRSSDLTFRYGGDEFLVILPGTNLDGARTAAGQILKALGNKELEAQGHRVTPQLSIGVASRLTGESSKELLQRADLALYQAKEAGRNRIC